MLCPGKNIQFPVRKVKFLLKSIPISVNMYIYIYGIVNSKSFQYAVVSIYLKVVQGRVIGEPIDGVRGIHVTMI